MKKSILALIVLLTTFSCSFGQNEEPVKKGDYTILKFDALNLMGIGVQKLNLGLELSPIKQNSNNLPTVQFNLSIPFNSLNENVEMNYGLEGGAELRFYQRRKNNSLVEAQGFYMGVGMDGGLAFFDLKDNYFKDNFDNPGDQLITRFNEYQRVRTGIAFLLGGQTKLGDRLYFDGNIGIGWSNVNVKADDTDLEIDGYNRVRESLNPFFLHFEEGKGQRFYMPLSVSIGYNFGDR